MNQKQVHEESILSNILIQWKLRQSDDIFTF